MKRTLAIVAAVLLAALGTVLLVSYVRGAEERALEGTEMVTVLVVDQPVERGSRVESLENAFKPVEVPAGVQAQGSVAELDDLAGLVAAVDLVPGEQVLSSRFITPESYVTRARIEVPPELLQTTLSLEPARAVGGQLAPGDHVAFIASFDPFQIGGVEPGDPELGLDPNLQPTEIEDLLPDVETTNLKTPNSTRIIIHKVLVTNVQVEELPVEDEEGRQVGPDLAPTGNLLITLAASAEDVEKMVFTAEHGFVWLAAEDDEAPEPDTDIRTRGNIYE